MKDDLHRFLRSRRSIRQFRTDPVPDKVIQHILETAIYAPSAHNLQPWRFVIVTGEETKLHLAEALADKFRQDMVADGFPEMEIRASVGRTIRRARQAPVIIILCRDQITVNPQPDAVREQVEMLMCTQSVALAGLQLLLAAHAEGLGATWICWPLFAPEETVKALELDPKWEPQGMIFLGFPAETPERQTRRPVKDVTLYR
jgi:coenzyme F420-0:L-glutamate ligase / coenzyme F420-1:gamma-L-glutamate ligase